MSSHIADIEAYRKRKANARVFEALEHLHTEILARLADDRQRVDPEEFEAFIVQVLGDHLMGDLDSLEDIQRLDENYRHFDARLRRCLQTKLQSLRHFSGVRKGSGLHRPR